MSLGWADLVTCHALPGPGVLDALRGVAVAGSGCVLVAEMSSQGTLATGDYTKGERREAKERSDMTLLTCL